MKRALDNLVAQRTGLFECPVKEIRRALQGEDATMSNLSADELNQALGTLGVFLQPDDIEALMSAFDLTGDGGRLDINEFLEAVAAYVDTP